jgi:hypothetical protein
MRHPPGGAYGHMPPEIADEAANGVCDGWKGSGGEVIDRVGGGGSSDRILY